MFVDHRVAGFLTGTDAELDCINEESPFYPGQVLRSKGKRSSFFKARIPPP